MKRVFVLMGILCLLLSSFALADDTTTVTEEVDDASSDLYADLGDVTLTQDAGLTPDSPFYFLDEFVERSLIGNDPQRALQYKEEKNPRSLTHVRKRGCTNRTRTVAKSR